MSNNDKNFEADDSYNKESPFSIGKILASIFFIVIGIFFVWRVFSVYRNAPVSALIILAVGFILLTIWHKGLYIYRYMLPAMIIILVFTAYPIIYTIYIAFTNFGTGHMQSKEGTRKILLNTKWEVNYDDPPLFAEFYGPEKQVKTYMEAYKKAYNDFFEREKKWRKQKKSDAYIDEKWDIEFYGKIQPRLTSSYLDSKIKLEDLTIVLYSQKEVVKDIEGTNKNIEETNRNNIEETDESVEEINESENMVYNSKPIVKVYLLDASSSKEKTSDGFKYFLREISLDDVDKYTSEKMLFGSSVYERDSLKKAELTLNDDSELSIFIDNIKNVYEGLKKTTPLVVKNEDREISNRASNYLIETSNQFMSKMSSFITDPNDKNKMQKLDPETFKYDKDNLVFEDSKQGRFAITKDGQPVKYWKEYRLQELDFDYGLLNLERDSVVETYLSKYFNEKTNIINEIDNLDLEGVVGIPIKEIDQAKLNTVNAKLKAINKGIAKFNRLRNEYRKDFIYEQRTRIDSEYPDLPESIDYEAMNKKILVKIKDEEDIKYLLDYYRVGLKSDDSVYILEKSKIDPTDEINYKESKKRLWDLLNASNVYNLDKEKNKRKNTLNRQKFPKYSDIKLIQIETSNVNENISIEPGYSIWIGAKNFQKIVSSKNITAPFLFVFLWTVAWAGISVISSFAVGLALALVFNASDFKGKYFYRTLFMLPYAIPSFVTILMWSGFLNKDFGVINNIFGLNIPWLMEGVLAKLSVLTVNLWLSFPYFMIISLGALQSIDSSMYEAADVDGATGFQQFTMITLPLLLMALGPMLVGSFAFSFNNFAGIYLLTGGGPTMAAGVLPGHTDILISYTYKLAFGEQNKDYGLASSIAIIVFLIIGTITFLQFKFTGTFKEVDNA